MPSAWTQIESSPEYQALSTEVQDEWKRKFIRDAHASDIPFVVKQAIMKELSPEAPEGGFWADRPGLELGMRMTAEAGLGSLLPIEELSAKHLFDTRPTINPRLEDSRAADFAVKGAGFAGDLLASVTGGGLAKTAAKRALPKLAASKAGRFGLNLIGESAAGATFGAVGEGTPAEKAKHAARYAVEFPAIGGAMTGLGMARRARMASKMGKATGEIGTKVQAMERTKGWFKGGTEGMLEKVEKMPSVVRSMPNVLFQKAKKMRKAGRPFNEIEDELVKAGMKRAWAKKALEYIDKEIVAPAILIKKYALIDAEAAKGLGILEDVLHHKHGMPIADVRTVAQNINRTMRAVGHTGGGEKTQAFAVVKLRKYLTNKKLSDGGRLKDPQVEAILTDAMRRWPTPTGGKPRLAMQQGFVSAAKVPDDIASAAAKERMPLTSNLDELTKFDAMKEVRAKDFTEPIPDEEILQLADQLMMDRGALMKRIRSRRNDTTAADVKAGVAILKDLETEAIGAVSRAQEAINQGVMRPDLLAEAETSVTAWAQHHQAILGFRAESGRTTRAFRGLTSFFEKPGEFYKNFDDVETAENVMRLFAKLDPTDTVQFRGFMAQSPFQKMKEIGGVDKVYAVWINMLLSNPVTHEVNFLSNMITALSRVGIEYPLRAMYDAIGSTVTGKRTYHVKPAFAAFGEMLKGTVEAVKVFGREIKDPSLIHKMTKAGEAGGYARLKGKWGRVLGAPGDFLAASDRAFKTAVRRAEMRRFAGDAAIKEGKRGKAYHLRIAEMMRTPSDAMRAAAEHEAQYVTFTKPLGRMGTNLMRFRDTHMLAKIIVPFFRTPTNIAKYGLERLPGIGMMGPKGGQSMADVFAKQTMGGLVGATVGMLCLDDKITGSGPIEPTARQAWFKAGNRPYSFRIGNTLRSYERFEPIGSIMGFEADMYEAVQEGKISDEWFEYFITKAGFAFSNLLLDKTFTRGITDVIEALTAPEQKGARLMESLIGSIVPSVVGSTARAIDPTMRELPPVTRDPGSGEQYGAIKTLIEGSLKRSWDIIKMRLPIMSEQFAPKLDNYGDPITRPGTAVSRGLTPMPGQEISKEKWTHEVFRLNVGVGKPPKGKHEKRLSYNDFRELIQEQGPEIKRRLKMLVDSRWYNELGDDKKADAKRIKALRRIIAAGRKVGRAKFLMKKSLPERKRLAAPPEPHARRPFSSDPNRP